MDIHERLAGMTDEQVDDELGGIEERGAYDGEKITGKEYAILQEHQRRLRARCPKFPPVEEQSKLHHLEEWTILEAEFLYGTDESRLC